MNAFVISRQYGELLDGYNATDADLRLLLRIPEPKPHQLERMSMLLAERDEWRACMDRCPMFVEYEHG